MTQHAAGPGPSPGACGVPSPRADPLDVDALRADLQGWTTDAVHGTGRLLPAVRGLVGDALLVPAGSTAPASIQELVTIKDVTRIP